ncbi:HAD family hydrolase [Kordiimonas aestuarii]|uniref:HAD family hydrolase n=1 Tax=Kordiimonas aestuarii TaxID=1005925 RepID=UPI0021D01852|nr:HAD family phosphatase [Kordiimonas aestuarii]
MTERTKAVLFDIGNVFVEWDPRNLYSKLIDDTQELEGFLADVVTLEWHTEHDRGRPFADGVRLLADKYPEYEDLIRAFDERWDETIGNTITGTVDVLEQLSEQGMRTFGLTNFSAEKWPSFCRQYAFTDLFGGVVVSGDEKLVKPDPRIYHVAIERFNLDPELTIYIDDRMDNVRAAEQLGMVGHHFTDANKLANDLRAKGFLY